MQVWVMTLQSEDSDNDGYEVIGVYPSKQDAVAAMKAAYEDCAERDDTLNFAPHDGDFIVRFSYAGFEGKFKWEITMQPVQKGDGTLA